MSTNPYAAPRATVADETVVTDSDLVPEGQPRPASHGWAWITAAWDLFKLQPWLWIGMWVLFFIILFATALIPFLGTILTAVFWPVLVAGFVVGSRTLDRGGQLELGHLFAGFRERLGTLIGIGALTFGISLVVGTIVGLAVGVGAFTMLGGADAKTIEAAGLTVVLAALITTALLLPVVMASWFAPALVAFHDYGVIDSMKASFRGCLKNVVPFLIYGVVLLVFGILALLPLGLGWLVLGPVISASIYTAYKDIYLRPRP